ncbi:hypothetical protein Lesp02_55500 [Lentzea sp. NBRC 105346]|uniref:hypothetical protein n=1 Tax=Lentzea sp. NBRC 105346 TaxID=3032205 RepID=UPI0024A297F9|nr:hypothetical protein [Lentzea sp. NBRC 105346]GLZ33362.1 hypothetical protein Lesp02_55500 [Lentzea sp. NBRC 105346]
MGGSRVLVLCALLAVGGCTAEPGAPVHGPRQQIPRTKVFLEVPAGMQVDENLPGLTRPGTRTNVLVSMVRALGMPPDVRIDGAASEYDSVNAPRYGLEVRETQRLTVAGSPAVAASGRRTQDNTSFVSVSVAVDDYTVLMKGTLEPNDPVSVDDLRALLLDVVWKADADPGGRGLDITPAAGYQRAGGLVFTLGGKPGPGVPELVVTTTDDKVYTPAFESFAVDRFQKLASKPVVDKVTMVDLAALNGYEVTGGGSYLMVLFKDDGCIMIAGTSDPVKYPDQVPAFREMARSLKIS